MSKARTRAPRPVAAIEAPPMAQTAQFDRSVTAVEAAALSNALTRSAAGAHPVVREWAKSLKLLFG